ncbi:hypothetical protein QUB60_02620 [Microcoleus sp. A2-C5]|nr:hypothetical protein [Lyngbya sp. CCAP 1446/10]
MNRLLLISPRPIDQGSGFKPILSGNGLCNGFNGGREEVNYL